MLSILGLLVLLAVAILAFGYFKSSAVKADVDDVVEDAESVIERPPVVASVPVHPAGTPGYVEPSRPATED